MFSLRSLLRRQSVVFAGLIAFAIASFAFIGFVAGAKVAVCAYLAVNLLCSPAMTQKLGATTLTATEILLDVISAFAKNFPALNLMGTQFTPNKLKLNRQYIAHIPSLPSTSTYDPTTGYANGAANARSLLTDVPITVNQQPTCPLKWLHLDTLKDNKREYDKVIAGAGYVLAKSCIDNLFSGVKSSNFSQQTIIANADFDFDALSVITGLANAQGMNNTGRVLMVNSSVANTLGGDSRLSSKDYSGQQPGGQGYRSWTNVGGFALIQEYPDLPSNNGAALTGVTAVAATDVITKATHGLVTGDRVVFTTGTGFTGLTAGQIYYAIVIDANTFKVATTAANAVAGTAVDITVDGSAGTFQKTENLSAFAFDARAFALLAGVPEGFQSELLASLGIPPVMGMKLVTDPVTRITMAAVSWQAAGTGDMFWCPTFVYGSALGRQSGGVAAGSLADYGGLRVVTA